MILLRKELIISALVVNATILSTWRGGGDENEENGIKKWFLYDSTFFMCWDWCAVTEIEDRDILNKTSRRNSHNTKFIQYTLAPLQICLDSSFSELLVKFKLSFGNFVAFKAQSSPGFPIRPFIPYTYERGSSILQVTFWLRCTSFNLFEVFSPFKADQNDFGEQLKSNMIYWTPAVIPHASGLCEKKI